MKRIFITEAQFDNLILDPDDNSDIVTITLGKGEKEYQRGEYFSISYIYYNGRSYGCNEVNTQPFWGFIDGQVVMGDISGLHGERFFRDEDLCIYGRIYNTDDDSLILVYDNWKNKIGDSLLYMIVRKAFEKTSLSGGQRFMAKNGDENLRKI